MKLFKKLAAAVLVAALALMMVGCGGSKTGLAQQVKNAVSLLPGLSGASGAEGPEGPQAARSSSTIAAARTAAVHRFQSFICGPSLSSYGSALLPSFILSPAAVRCQWADAPKYGRNICSCAKRLPHSLCAAARGAYQRGFTGVVVGV